MCSTVNVIACTKHVPWVQQFVYEGSNYTTGGFEMQIRQLPGQTGTPIVNLINAAPGAQGISANYDAAYVDPNTGETFTATIFTVTIAKSTMKALVGATPVNASIELHYDFHLTPVGASEFMPFKGKFTYDPGVTI